MKNLLTISLFVAFTISSQVIAQTGKSKSYVLQTAGQAEQAPTGTKADFINKQNYLSASSLKDFNNIYGDSLRHFDEKTATKALWDNAVYGQEFINCMKYKKRQYIDNKYNIGTARLAKTAGPGQLNTPQNTYGNKPIGGSNTINNAPCVNEDFEATPVGAYFGAANSTAIQGWVISSYVDAGSGCAQNLWQPGSPEIWVKNTPVFGIPGLGTLGNSPLGGNNVVQLQDATTNTGNGGLETKIVQTFPVTSANTLFQFAFAGAWEDGGHTCCTQPALKIKMYNCVGAPLTCSSLSLNATGSSCTTGSSGYTVTQVGGVNVSWTNWQVKYIDLTPFVGSCVTIEIINSDCTATGHYGSLYFDAKCGGQLVGTGNGLGGTGGSVAGPVSFCAGSGQALIQAPLGYSTYQWYAPVTGAIPPSQGGAAPTLTITNPLPGSTYTVILTTGSGCTYTSTNLIATSTINIAGIGSGPTCPNGASGTATVVGNGSGSGYTYTWTNSGGTTVGSNSVATGLAAGVYNVVIGGLGAAGCGTAMATTTVASSPPPIINLLRNYCGGEAYLAAPLAGSNYQWYAGNTTPPTPISFVNGGNASSYTVTSPSSQAVYWLSYLSAQGCQDSVKFTLSPTTPGIMNVASAGTICPGATNGVAVINMFPVNTGIPTNNFTLTPAATPNASVVTSLSSNTYMPSGLSAGTYSLSAFDGSCKYSTTFNVSTLNYNFTITPATPTLCSGVSAVISLNFNTSTLPGQYTYSWSPSTFLITNNSISSQITPTCPPGQLVNLIYTVTATSSLASCQVTKTMTVTVINPLTPTLTAVPYLCDNGSPYTISVTPTGGTFSMGTVPNGSQILNPGSGVITPSLASIGVNSFTYQVGVQQCTASATGTFHVSHFNPALLTSSVPSLCVTSGLFDLMAIVQSTATGVWYNSANPSNPTAAGIFGAIGSQSINPAVLGAGVYPITYSTTSTPIAGVCSASSTLNVSVTNTSTPILSTPTASFCTNHAPITLTTNSVGGTWSGTGISPGGIVTPSVLTNAVYYYIFTIPFGPCVNTNSIALHVSQFNSAAITGAVPDLCVNSPNFDLMGIVSSTVNGAWVSTSGPPIHPNTLGLLTPSNTAPGNAPSHYVYTYFTSPTPPFGEIAASCPHSNTIAVSVYNPPAPNIVQTSAHCSIGEPFQLSVTPATGTWVATPYLTTGGLFTPSAAIVGNNMVQYVIGTNTCNSLQSKNISIEAFVPATISTTMIPDKCTTGAIVDLSLFAVSNSGAWSGPGVSGSSFNPNAAGQGNFILTHNSASSPSGLCPDQATVAVNVYSLQPPMVSKIGPFCTSAPPTMLQPSPVGGIFGGSNNNAVTSAGLFNPAAGIAGDNIITYSITSGPCVAYATTTVTIERLISADLREIPEISGYCKNDVGGQLFLDKFVANTGGTWGGHPAVSGKMFVYANANIGDNNIVYYQISSLPSGVCTDTSAIRIKIKDAPQIQLRANAATSGCAPLKVTFNANTNVQSNLFKWDLGDGVQENGVTDVEHTFTSPGTYTVTFHPVGECAQPVSYGSPVTVYEMPKASFSAPDEIYISNPAVQFNNHSTVLGNNKYEWKIGSLYQLNDIEAKVVFPAIGRYPVTLTAITPNGCKDVVTKVIEVKNEFNIFIPTSFTPNFDGLNDYFMPKFSPYGLDEKTFDMEIFDRWGHLVFKSKDPAKGWDGTVQNKGADMLKEDVYVFKIKYKDIEGNVYDKIGHITLIR